MQDKSTDLSEIYGRINPSDNIETSVILGLQITKKKKHLEYIRYRYFLYCTDKCVTSPSVIFILMTNILTNFEN